MEEKVFYRCLCSDELMSMINPSAIEYSRDQSNNTFNYDKNVNYKHFYIFGDHAQTLLHHYKASLIGAFVIKEELIEQTGFGFYTGVKTKYNDKLSKEKMPIPEMSIKEEKYSKDYLIDLHKDFDKEWYDGIKGNPYEKRFSIEDKCYSYADIYYELVYELANKRNMTMQEIAEYLQKLDLRQEIKKYFEENCLDIFKEKVYSNNIK